MRGGTSRAIHLTLHSDVIGSSSISARVFSGVDDSLAGSSGDGLIVIEPQADLGITLQGPSSVTEGDAFEVSFSVANRSSIAAAGITLVIDTPAQAAATNAVLGGGSCERQNTRIECSLPSLAPGATANGSMSVGAISVSNFVVRARVSGAYVDSDTSNDEAELTVRMAAAPQSASQTTSSAAGQGGGGSSSLPFLFGLLALRQCRRLRGGTASG
jgi:hypothetical protein